MKKLEKLLRKASRKDRRLLLETIAGLAGGSATVLNVRKLGHNAYRLRKGSYRIFFHYDSAGTPIVDDIRRRNEGTYRNT